uniref:Uncharacterized protein n=1 Tax=Caenorhabditis japonica TaxID=281687 RepID=A0A8R1ID86_CAEJA
MDDIDEPPSRRNGSEACPHWLDKPRDHTVLPDIIASTYSDFHEESDFAMKQMLAILETLNPIADFLELFEKSMKAIEFRMPFPLIMESDGKPDWKAIRQKLTSDLMAPGDEEVKGLSSAQMSAVFDALPFLFDTVVCHPQLHQFQDLFSMLVMMAMTGNSLKRKQINSKNLQVAALLSIPLLSSSINVDN